MVSIHIIKKKKKKTAIREFIEAIIAYSKGESVKGLKVYKSTRNNERIEILDISGLWEVDILDG